MGRYTSVFSAKPGSTVDRDITGLSRITCEHGQLVQALSSAALKRAQRVTEMRNLERRGREKVVLMNELPCVCVCLCVYY